MSVPDRSEGAPAPVEERPSAVIVAGPTASGKSALALAIAERLGGTIINADSMQVYAELRILTARPTPAEEARVPHALYGVRPAAEAGSAAWWRGAALEEMERSRAAGRLPILCGGSGLYFSALVQGMADIPSPGAAARAEARALLDEIGPAALHARLAELDPETARKLRPTDSQRVARAWEVLRGTGHGITYWLAQGEKAQGEKAQGERAQEEKPASWRFSALVLDPPREALRAAIATRFAAMLAEGALEEARALLAQRLDPALPAMRAHGVPELAAHLRGEIALHEAARRAELVTGQYTKRQATWFRHHKLSDSGRTHTIHARFTGLTQFSEREAAEIFNFIQSQG